MVGSDAMLFFFSLSAKVRFGEGVTEVIDDRVNCLGGILTVYLHCTHCKRFVYLRVSTIDLVDSM